MIGFDLLGIGSRHWNIKDTVRFWRELKEPLAVGAFDSGWPHAFGDPRSAIQKIIDTGNCPAARIQEWWSAGSHAMASESAVIASSKKWEAFARRNAGKCKIYLSPTCEYREPSIKVVQNRLNLVKKYAPSCIPVLSPWQSPTIPGTITEKHGTGIRTGPGQTASYDGGKEGAGFDEEQSAEAWMRDNIGADLCFAWSPIFNCSESHNTLLPDQRRASPDFRYLKAIYRLMHSKGAPAAPAFSGAITPIKKPCLYKTFGEDQQGASTRDNKPLLIVKGAARVAVAIDRLGNALGRFTVMGFDRPGAYPGGLTRYYSGGPGGSNIYGWQMAEKAALSGSEFVWFKVDNKTYGPVHPAFREGFYQT